MKVWIETSVWPNKMPTTAANYARQVRNHIVPGLESLSLSELIRDHIQHLCNRRTAAGLSHSTVRHIHAVLRAALTFTVGKRLLLTNPAQGVSLPFVEMKKSRILSSAEVERFLSAATAAEDRYLAVYHVAFFGGLRIGEILGLDWRHVDLATRELSVRHQVQRLKGRGLVMMRPKQDQQRTVPFGDRVRDSLLSHKARQQEAASGTPGYEDNGLVFATVKGTPLDPQNVVNRSYKPILESCSLPAVTFHSSRHSCATTMIQRHVDIGTVSAILGHQDVATTLRFYGHVIPKMTRHAAEVFDIPA